MARESFMKIEAKVWREDGEPKAHAEMDAGGDNADLPYLAKVVFDSMLDLAVHYTKIPREKLIKFMVECKVEGNTVLEDLTDYDDNT